MKTRFLLIILIMLFTLTIFAYEPCSGQIEPLFIDFENTECIPEIEDISMFAILFKEVNGIVFGKKLKILEADNIEQGVCHMRFIEVEKVSGCETFQLSILTDVEKFEKYIILQDGIKSFFELYNPLIITTGEDKKISLFESEWVAWQSVDARTLYRDSLENLRSTIIRTSIPDCSVYLGNVEIGRTPFEIVLTEDTALELTIVKEGFYDHYIKLIPETLTKEYFINMEEISEDDEEVEL